MGVPLQIYGGLLFHPGLLCDSLHLTFPSLSDMRPALVMLTAALLVMSQGGKIMAQTQAPPPSPRSDNSADPP